MIRGGEKAIIEKSQCREEKGLTLPESTKKKGDKSLGGAKRSVRRSRQYEMGESDSERDGRRNSQAFREKDRPRPLGRKGGFGMQKGGKKSPATEGEKRRDQDRPAEGWKEPPTRCKEEDDIFPEKKIHAPPGRLDKESPRSKDAGTKIGD